MGEFAKYTPFNKLDELPLSTKVPLINIDSASHTIWDYVEPELSKKLGLKDKVDSSVTHDPEIVFGSPSAKQLGKLVEVCHNAKLSSPISNNNYCNTDTRREIHL